MRDVLFEGEGLQKHFETKRRGRGRATVKAVDGVDLVLRRGECLALVGESGCGKSTLATLVTHLEPPTSGEMRFEGKPVGADRRTALAFRRDVQIVLQDPFTSLNPRMTIEAILREPFEIHADLAPRAEWHDRAVELLEMVGLREEHLARYPHEFSGGQRQRIALARAIVHRPDVLVGDEPLSALDVTVRAQILDLIRELRELDGLTLLMVSHDIGVVQSLCDSVVVMKDGAVVERGSTKQVLRHPAEDYTKRLLAAIPTIDPERAG